MGTVENGGLILTVPKEHVTRRSRFTGPGKGYLFFVTFFGANRESKYNGFNALV